MTAYEFMQKHARGLANGLGWAEHLFRQPQRFAPEDLIDAAVDIAWERLLPQRPRVHRLVVERRFNMLYFRSQPGP